MLKGERERHRALGMRRRACASRLSLLPDKAQIIQPHWIRKIGSCHCRHPSLTTSCYSFAAESPQCVSGTIHRHASSPEEVFCPAPWISSLNTDEETWWSTSSACSHSVCLIFSMGALPCWDNQLRSSSFLPLTVLHERLDACLLQLPCCSPSIGMTDG